MGKADGVLGMTLSANRPDERGQAFKAAWQEAYDEDPPFSIAAQIYDEVIMWAQAVEKVGSVRDFDAIDDAIRSTPYDGVTGTFRFNDQHYVPASDDTVPAHLLQVQDSRTVQLMIGSKKYADFQVPPWIE